MWFFVVDAVVQLIVSQCPLQDLITAFQQSSYVRHMLSVHPGRRHKCRHNDRCKYVTNDDGSQVWPWRVAVVPLYRTDLPISSFLKTDPRISSFPAPSVLHLAIKSDVLHCYVVRPQLSLDTKTLSCGIDRQQLSMDYYNQTMKRCLQINET